MIPITINNIKAQLPTGWHEVTIQQYIELLKADSFIKNIAILTGLPYNDILHADVNLDDTLLPHLQYLTEEVNPQEWKKPDFIKIEGKEIKVPENLDFECYGQKVLYQQKEKAEIEKQMQGREEDAVKDIDLTTLIIPALAVYLEPYYYGEKFNDEKVDEFKEIAAKIPCMEAWPTAFFLFRKYSALKNCMLLDSNQTNLFRLISYLKKLALKSYRRLEQLQLSISLRKGMYYDMKK